jgi:hypothetical protein
LWTGTAISTPRWRRPAAAAANQRLLPGLPAARHLRLPIDLTLEMAAEQGLEVDEASSGG